MKKTENHSSNMATVMLFGYDLSKINWKMVSYFLVSIAVMIIGLFYTYNPDALARTLIFAVGGSLVFYFFYLRWFGQAEAVPEFWPPAINSCPDYLTLGQLAGSTTNACADYLGVAIGDTPLVKVNPSEPLSAGNSFRYTSADVIAARDAGSIMAICTECKNKGVTWEGVWDGDNCVGMNRFLTQKQIADSKGCPA